MRILLSTTRVPKSLFPHSLVTLPYSCRGEVKCFMEPNFRSSKPNNNRRKITTPIESDEYFGTQTQSTGELGDPIPVLKFLAQSVIETIAGVRDIDQSARWLSDSVYQQLRQRATANKRALLDKNQQAMRPNLTVGKISSFSPRDGVVEGVVIVHNKDRARAVAIRLEGYNGRWRAKSVAVL